MLRTPPWEKDNPRKKAGEKSKRPSPKKEAAAKRSAKKSGRSGPSLIDNMRAAGKMKNSKKKSKARKR